MKKIKSLLHSVWLGLSTHKLRSFLTTLGIVIGRLLFFPGQPAGLQTAVSENYLQYTLNEHFDELKPQLQAGIRLRELGVKCCIDVSDGLLQDAGHLADTSHIGMDIEITSVPEWQLLCSKAGEASALQAVAHGGEDYALLFTAPAQMEVPDGLAVKIGLCREGSGIRLLQSGQSIEVGKTGFDHFG